MTNDGRFYILLDRDTRQKGAIFTNQELRKILNESLPRVVQMDMVRGLAQAYRDLFDECRAYPKFLDRDAMGQLRRIKFDTVLLSLANRWGIKAEVAPNVSHNCFHTRLQAGRLILTASCVPSPNSMVRDAEFRKTYARDPQLQFPWGAVEEEPGPDSPVYAIFLHGVNREAKTEEEQAMPGFARIAFPNQSCSKYLEIIDLLAPIRNTIHDGFDVEEATKAFGINLKQDKARKKRNEQ